ncbi:MAG: Ribose-phosphate pyrophosphokinase [Chlamydiae bacterium]|nr:Ribose-phosphate pyrophosphokinase [Chlamydiota bacterium]
MSIDQEACLFSGTSHPELAKLIASHNKMKLGSARVDSFPDGEIFVQIQENVRGKVAFIVQSLAHRPNYYLMELLIMIDALKRASAKSIVVLLPYYAYSRQDRKDKGRVPITAKLVANLLETAGASRVLTMDLHTDQIQGFFDIPSDNLQARPALAQKIKAHDINLESTVIAAPDIGSVRLVKAMADQLKTDFVIIDKRRLDAETVEHSPIIGDVKEKTVVFVDDMCSTAKTLCRAAEACKKAGAKDVFATVTHGVFAKEAIENIEKSPIEKIWISNTIAQDSSKKSSKIEEVSIAHLFGEGIRCVLYKNSMSSLFTP